MRLTVNGLSFSYNGTPVLREAALRVEEHQMVAILGPNGAGKTTLLRCINRILSPSRGTVFLGYRDLASLPRRELARELSYVAQHDNPARLTVFDTVLLGRRPFVRWDAGARDFRKTEEVLDRLGLSSLALRYADTLSGGEYQKVCLARALVQEPRVMLLDEPTSSLDLKNQLEIMRLLRSLADERPLSVLMTMHDLNTAFRYADRFVFLKGGTVCADVGRREITPRIIEQVYGVSVNLRWDEGHPIVVPLEPLEVCDA